MIEEHKKNIILMRNRYQRDPAAFFREVLGIHSLEDYHEEILRCVAINERTSIAACHDVGKSWITARIVLWFLYCFPFSKVITTAPTYNQVKNILWSEIRTAHSRAKFPLGGTMNLTELVLGEGWFAIGFTPKNEVSFGEGQGTQSSFQGFHAEGGLMVVFDEATGILPPIWVMAEGLLTQAFVKFIAIGNPTSRNSDFYKCFSSRAWSKIYLNCFNSPNLIANGITDMQTLEKELQAIREMDDTAALTRMNSYKTPRTYLLSLKWVIASVLKWGINHPLSVSKIFGKFPEGGDRELVGLGELEEAQRRLYYPVESDRKTIGVDVARFGSDASVITGLHGFKFVAKQKTHKRDLTELTGHVIQFYREHGADVIVVDETGLGSGVVDNLREAQRQKIIDRNTEIRGVQFGAAPECNGGKKCDHSECDKAHFVNLKARMYSYLRDDLKKPEGLCLPFDDIYLEELPSILYTYDTKGKFIIESKDDYKKRTRRNSPDDSDSLALANYGRYDEITVSAFDTTVNSFPVPHSRNLMRVKKW